MSQVDGYTTNLTNGIKPICAVCDVQVYTEELTPFWYWLSVDELIYYFHTECGLNNMESSLREEVASVILGSHE